MEEQMKRLPPFFSFYGSKYRILPRYPVPRHDVIIEPFAGSASYACMYHDREVVLYDLDENIVALWDYLIRATEEEILALPDLKEDQAVRDLDICMGAKMLVGYWLSKAAATPRQTASAWMRTHPENGFWGGKIRARIASNLQHIRHWKIRHGTYADIPDQDACWFIDPPYRSGGQYYRKGNRTIDYDSMGQWCQSRSGQVIVCEKLGAKWLPFTAMHPCRGTKNNTTEAIWENK